MAISQTEGVFQTGPLGRNINVNASGQIIATEGGVLEPYGGSDKGRFIGVDANGRLGVIISSPIDNTSPSGSGAFDLAGKRQFDIILDENITFTSFLNADEGAKYLFILQQDGVGGRTVTWPSNVKWRGGSAPTITSGVNAIDVVSMVYRNRDATFLADVGQDFS